MRPRPPQPSPTAYLEQYPAPGPVRGLAVMLWISAGISLVMLVINMTTAPMSGVEPGYAFGYSLPHTLIGVLLAVTAVPVTRGRSWARRMAKVVLIIQIVWQSMMVIGGTLFLWALLLLPLAIAGVVLMHQPLSKWFFTVHKETVYQEYSQQAYGQQPPQNGSWGQDPRQQ